MSEQESMFKHYNDMITYIRTLLKFSFFDVLICR